MRISVGMLGTAAALFTVGASGVLGTWALVSATVIGLIGAVTTVTVIEDREHAQALVTLHAADAVPSDLTNSGDDLVHRPVGWHAMASGPTESAR